MNDDTTALADAASPHTITPDARYMAVLEALCHAQLAIGATDSEALTALNAAHEMLHAGHSGHRALERGRSVMVECMEEREWRTGAEHDKTY